MNQIKEKLNEFRIKIKAGMTKGEAIDYSDDIESLLETYEKKVQALRDEHKRLNISFGLSDDRVQSLEACLEAIKKQAAAGSQIEILCVAGLDNGGN
jgi:predicted nuclease with TOPRIM domain